MKTDFNEIDEGTGYIGYREAFDITGANVRPVGDETLSLDLCVCRQTKTGMPEGGRIRVRRCQVRGSSGSRRRC